MSWKQTFFIRFFLVLMLFSSIKLGVFYGFYTLDRAGFIQMFCENKERPELECNGKCHIKKVIKTNSDDNKKTNELNFKLNVAPLFFEEISYFIFSREINIQKNNFNYINLYDFLSGKIIFHPPVV